MEIKQIHHICIQTEDYSASKVFYVDILGFDIIQENRGFHSREYNTWLKAGDIMIELQTPKSETQFRSWSKLNSGPVHLAFVVKDVTAAYKEVKNAGWSDFKVKDGNELYPVKGNYIFKVRAPEGTEIEIRDVADIG